VVRDSLKEKTETSA